MKVPHVFTLRKVIIERAGTSPVVKYLYHNFHRTIEGTLDCTKAKLKEGQTLREWAKDQVRKIDKNADFLRK